MCVGVYACVVFMCVHVCVCAYCRCIHMYACICAHVCMCLCVHMCVGSMCICMCVHVCKHVVCGIFMCVVCLYVPMCVYVCVLWMCVSSQEFSSFPFFPLHYFMASEDHDWEFVSQNLRWLKKFSQCPEGASWRSQGRHKAPGRTREEDLGPSGRGGKACVFGNCGSKAHVMGNCRCQLGWAIGCPDI